MLFKDAVVHPRIEAYVGWTGMASASSLEHFNANHRSDVGFETIEIDPQFAQGLGLAQGDVVCGLLSFLSPNLAKQSIFRLKLASYTISHMQNQLVLNP
jgi:hypothetical protein